jgi:hypothetical protein
VASGTPRARAVITKRPGGIVAASPGLGVPGLGGVPEHGVHRDRGDHGLVAPPLDRHLALPDPLAVGVGGAARRARIEGAQQPVGDELGDDVAVVDAIEGDLHGIQIDRRERHPQGSLARQDEGIAAEGDARRPVADGHPMGIVAAQHDAPLRRQPLAQGHRVRGAMGEAGETQRLVGRLGNQFVDRRGDGDEILVAAARLVTHPVGQFEARLRVVAFGIDADVADLQADDPAQARHPLGQSGMVGVAGLDRLERVQGQLRLRQRRLEQVGDPPQGSVPFGQARCARRGQPQGFEGACRVRRRDLHPRLGERLPHRTFVGLAHQTDQAFEAADDIGGALGRHGVGQVLARGGDSFRLRLRRPLGDQGGAIGLGIAIETRRWKGPCPVRGSKDGEDDEEPSNDGHAPLRIWPHPAASGPHDPSSRAGAK